MNLKGLLSVVCSFLLLYSCTEKRDALSLKNASIKEYEKIERDLGSKSTYVNSKQRLPSEFLPIDTNLVFYKKMSYERKDFVQLPMFSRAFEDSLGNQLIVYEWDKITPNMSEMDKEEIKREFDKYHSDYVSRYNYLTNQITEELGSPISADKKLQSNEMEVYKMWKSEQVWKSENQVAELSFVMMPSQMYRVILKVLVLNKSAK